MLITPASKSEVMKFFACSTTATTFGAAAIAASIPWTIKAKVAGFINISSLVYGSGFLLRRYRRGRFVHWRKGRLRGLGRRLNLRQISLKRRQIRRDRIRNVFLSRLRISNADLIGRRPDIIQRMFYTWRNLPKEGAIITFEIKAASIVEYARSNAESTMKKL